MSSEFARPSQSICRCLDTVTALYAQASKEAEEYFEADFSATVADELIADLKEQLEYAHLATLSLSPFRDFVALYDAPPDPIGPITAPCYHELGFTIAHRVFCDVSRRAPRWSDAEAWEVRRRYLREAAPKFDCDWLKSMIQDESVRAERRRASQATEVPAPQITLAPENRNPSVRLTVDTDPAQAILDGKPYSIRADAVDFLAALIEALTEGEDDWVSGSQMDLRADRVKASLPEPIQKLIESAPGKGYRISRQILA